MNGEKPAPRGASSSGSVGSRQQKGAENQPAAQARNPIPPPPLNGVHQWLMEAAWAGRKARLPLEVTIRKICEYEETARRQFGPGEVEEAVEKVYMTKAEKARRSNGSRSRGKPKEAKVRWNSAETQQIHERNPFSIDEWRAASPVKEPEQRPPEEILRMLFADDDTLVCAGRSMSCFFTGTLSEHGDLRGHQFVVPGPMSARRGRTKSDPERWSDHTLENTGPRMFFVLDFDEPPPEHHASIIRHLAQFRSPALILSSGGKSLHGWFPIFPGKSCKNVLFERLAIGLGADSVLFRNRSQFVRMPNGTRENGKMQEVAYLDPGSVLNPDSMAR